MPRRLEIVRRAEASLERGLPVPEPADAPRVLEIAAAKARAGQGGVLVTVVARHGSAPSTPGQKLFLAADGTCVGTVGGGAIEREILGEIAGLVARQPGEVRHVVREYKLGAELGMCCGGRAEVLIEPIEGLVPCLVVGGGHVATATAPLLAKVGFAVTVCDARDAWAAEGRITGVRCEVGEHDEVGRDLPERAAVLVMTHDHALDQAAIEWALRRGFAYVGGVGSRAKAARTRERLEHKGFSADQCARVRMPLGVSIGARLPDEIAVAIVAELVGWRRGR